jgi:hypothetical protein
MDHLGTGEPVWALTFDDKGALTAPSGSDLPGEVIAENVADLFVFSHGWGTSEQGAQQLYDAMFPLIRDAAVGVPGLGPIGFAGIYWPSLWFPDSPATPPPTSGSTQSDDGSVQRESTGSASLTGKEIVDSLLPGFVDPQQRATLTRLGELIDDGEAAAAGESDVQKQARLTDLHALLQSLVPPVPDSGFEDSGETALLLTDAPEQAYQQAADVFGSAPPSSSTQSLGDWFGKAMGGLKDTVRVLSYATMKTRAGDIGRTGLGPLLVSLHGQAPGVRVHLIGHSFGARLVSFALAGIADPVSSPVASLLLVQGAFSHWSFAPAQDNPFGEPGALNGFADRVHGPLVATFTPFDWAVGVWYPKASFLAQQSTSAGVAGRWGGMGSDGYQAASPVVARSMPAAGGRDYGLVPGTFYPVDASAVINNVQGQSFAGAHSDIRKVQVADLAVAAAAAHA